MTVVVPTLWRPEVRDICLEGIASLVKLPAVSKVAVINNSQGELPAEPAFKHRKTVIFNSPHNLYVNPSWNLGALLAGEDHCLMLLNDDIAVSPEAVEAAEALLKREDCLIGCGGVIPPDHPFDAPEISLYPGRMAYAFGCCMAMRTKSWPVIPPSMLVYFGDNWIMHRFRGAGRRVFGISAGSFRGGLETTSRGFGDFFGGDQAGFAAALAAEKEAEGIGPPGSPPPCGALSPPCPVTLR